MKEIPLGKSGKFTLVDDEDYEELSKYKWHITYYGYAARQVPHPTITGRQTHFFMHRHLLGLTYGDPRQGDHRDMDKLNNQRANLRICNRAQNCSNRKKHPRNSSGYKGVRRIDRKRNPWMAFISSGRKRIHIGVFKTAEEAYEAYCKAAKELHGEFANLDPSSQEDAVIA